MRAIACRKYGPPEVLELFDAPKPIPKDDEILIRIVAANIFPGDCELRRFDVHPSLWIIVRLMIGITRPRNPILGQEMSGEVEAVGKEVSNYKVGDEVFGSTRMLQGAYAEYICIPAKYGFAKRPSNVSHLSAATLAVGGTNALHFIRKANLIHGEKILIFGAAGSIGTYAIQLAKIAGAEVTAVDSGKKLGLLKTLGADKQIDYQEEDFTKNGIRYDVILDVVGKSPYGASLRSLTVGGRYVLANVGLSVMLRGLWTSLVSDKSVLYQLASMSTEHLQELRDLIADGKIEAAIDRTYTLEEVVEAHRYIESGNKAGHVVLKVGEEK